MELRSLKRVFLFNHAIKKTGLTKPQFHYLYAIKLLAPLCRFKHLLELMKKVNRQPSPMVIYKYLDELISKGYIERKGFLYTVTQKGNLILYEVEKKIRMSRVDKVINYMRLRNS